jgi:hypothetical protein
MPRPSAPVKLAAAVNEVDEDELQEGREGSARSGSVETRCQSIFDKGRPRPYQTRGRGTSRRLYRGLSLLLLSWFDGAY